MQFWAKQSDYESEDDGTVPDEWLEADIKQGISDSDVEHRRKRFGWNELASEKENMFIKFLTFFTGPILYGESPSASRTHPKLLLRVLRPQWLERCSVLLFIELPRASLQSSGRKMLGARARCCRAAAS